MPQKRRLSVIPRANFVLNYVTPIKQNLSSGKYRNGKKTTRKELKFKI